MPEIRYTLKAKFSPVQEWEFDAAELVDLECIILSFAEFLRKPKFEDIDMVIEPYIVIEEELEEND